MHRRRVVRDAAVALLKGLPLTGNRVYAFRTMPLDQMTLPAIRVFTPAETIAGNTFQGDYDARIEMRVEIVAKALDPVENEIDDICEQVEAVLEGGDHNLGGACVYLAFSGTEIDYEDEDQTVMVASMNFEVIITRG